MDKTALITGGDSGIGRAVAYAFALEGADVIVHYLDEHQDAAKTKQLVEKTGRRCWLLASNLQSFQACENLVKQALKLATRVDILVNNVAEQHVQEKPEEISREQLEQTFETNFFSYFYMIKALLPHLHEGNAMINTTYVTAYKGNKHLIDYSATKGAIVALTRSLSQNLVERGIRVNAVAPGPIWTPLIPASFSAKHVAEFGGQVP